MSALTKALQLSRDIYHFDIYDNKGLLSARQKQLAILASLTIPPIALIAIFFITDSLIREQGFAFAQFSESPSVPVGESGGLLILLFMIVFGHQLLNAFLAPLDLWVRSKHEQKPIAWEDCFVFSIASFLISATAIVFLNLPIADWLVAMFSNILNAFNAIEPVASIPFIWLVVLVYVLDDVFFYIGHRLSHNVRIMWKLGHMQHHRPTHLTSATSCADFSLFFLNGGGGSFVTKIVGKAFFFKLFSSVDATQALQAAILIASLRVINHSVSHSYAGYLLFSSNKYLALLEKFFVTGRVHYTHHSKLPEHNVAAGCNFAAQFVWIDKLMGTYAKPNKSICETGLFHEVRPPGNPIKFAFDQWIIMGRELYFNSPRYWLKILFADPGYEPPVPAYIN